MLWGLAVVLPALVLAGVHWHELTANLSDQVLATHNLLLLWLIYPLIKALHELGHGYAVKAGDGEVHEMGIMLLVLAPIPYVDATAAGAFRSKWRRALVGAAGMLVELFLAGIAMLLWVARRTRPGALDRLQRRLVAGASTLLFNGNPLLRYDGYYVLADLIEMPNLGNRSNQYWQWLAKRYLFGATHRRSAAGERRRATLVPLLRCRFVSLPHAGDDRHHPVHRRRVLLRRRRAGDLGGDHDVRAAARPRGCRTCCRARNCSARAARARLVTFGSLALFLLFVLAVPLPLRTMPKGVVWVPENAEVRAAPTASSSGCSRRPSVGQRRRSAAGDARAGARRAGRREPGARAPVRGAVCGADVRRARAGGGDPGRPAAGRVALARAEEKLDSLLVIARCPACSSWRAPQDLPGAS
jgi:putative peptide zinc metalloprotease protein